MIHSEQRPSGDRSAAQVKRNSIHKGGQASPYKGSQTSPYRDSQTSLHKGSQTSPYKGFTCKSIDGGASQGRGSHASGSCHKGAVPGQSPQDVLQQQGLACPRTACEEDTVPCSAQPTTVSRDLPVPAQPVKKMLSPALQNQQLSLAPNSTCVSAVVGCVLQMTAATAAVNRCKPVPCSAEPTAVTCNRSCTPLACDVMPFSCCP